MTQVSRCVVLSDVSVGYGTPQILSIARSMASFYGAQVTLLEPDQPERPPLPSLRSEPISIQRLYTATHPYTVSGRTEYALAAARHLDAIKPDVLIFSSFLGVPALLVMEHRPKTVIYYGLEHTDGERANDCALFRSVSSKIDAALFCEENRAVLDRSRLGLEGKLTAIVYNGSEYDPQVVAPDQRNGRFFYGGLIHPQLTHGDYFLGGGLDDYPIDLHGILDGYSNKDQLLAVLRDRKTAVSYRGYVPSGLPYLTMLSDYNFSLVFWAPVKESFKFAAPNKFFDAIAAGVPPIVAPHPLCEKIVRRYGLGLVMDGWTLSDVRRSLAYARSLVGTSAYECMVHACAEAHHDLKWSTQFQKVVSVIDEHVAQRSDSH